MVAIAEDADIRSVPKVELHVHLGGVVDEDTATELAVRHGEDRDDALRLVDGRYPGRYDGFGPFLETFLASNALVRDPADLELVATRFAAAQAAQGVRYSEIIFTAMIYARNGMDPAAMWRALRTGLASAGPDTRINLVVDIIRDNGWPEARATLDLVAAADAPIVGMCLTGVEGTVPTADFVELRAESRRMGLGLEVHAGEMGPPSSIVEALDILEADRIGHGVAAIHDPALLERLVRDATVLDVCPSSNVAIGLFPSLEAHPFAALWHAGANVTVSSDDPPFFGTSLTDELRHVVRVVGLSRDDLAELQRRAARAAFLPDADRATLVALVEAWVMG